MSHQSVPVLDFGSQTAQLIVRRLRELGVYSELLPHDAPEAQVRALNPVGLVLSGGPASVYEPGAPQMPDWLPGSGLPVLGICYGMQLMSLALGGVVLRPDNREFGPAEVGLLEPHPLFAGTPATQPVWMSHGDRIEALPPGFRAVAANPATPFAAMAATRGAGTACSSTPRWCTPPTAAPSSATSSSPSAVPRPTGAPPSSWPTPSRPCAPRSAPRGA
jgi:GMP synthase (glutamine-hydrolysing)